MKQPGNRSPSIPFAWGFAGALAALLLGLCATAQARNYTDPTKVNLFHKVDRDGNFQVSAAWADASNGGASYGGSYAIDSGNYSAQWNFSFVKSPSNLVALQISMAEPVHVQTLVQEFGDHRPMQYRMLASTTGFSGMTEIVSWTNANPLSNGPYAHTVNTSFRYLRIEYQGTTNSQYLLVREVQAFAGAGDAIDMTDGYNLFCESSANGGPGPITQYSGRWEGAPGSIANIKDLNYGSYLVGGTNYVGETTNCVLIIPLNATYLLTAASSGAYHGQGWNGITIEVTESAVVNGSETWRKVFERLTAFDSLRMSFGGRFAARNVRVTEPCSPTVRNAMCELEFYAAPPPAGVSVILK